MFETQGGTHVGRRRLSALCGHRHGGRFSLRGKEIPDWIVGVAAPIAGAVFAIVLSDSPFGLLFGLALIAMGGVAWYRYFTKRGDKPDPSA